MRLRVPLPHRDQCIVGGGRLPPGEYLKFCFHNPTPCSADAHSLTDALPLPAGSKFLILEV